MVRIFITGSADGLGLLAARELVGQGHEVVLHARNEKRGQEALAQVPGAAAVVTADLASMEETRQLAAKVNALGKFDAVIHNAGVYQAPANVIFAINTLAPYILTCLIAKPDRLIYLSSGMHRQGRAKLPAAATELGKVTYSDSKLQVLLLCKAVARKWPQVYANAVDPGWVPTKMGGQGAPDDLRKGYETQVWLAVSNEEKAKMSGGYFFHQAPDRYYPEADAIDLQDQLFAICQELTGVSWP